MQQPQQFGRYQVISLLGTGGMGQVWLAKDPHLERKVALKVIRREVAHGESLRRFQAESLAAARSHSTHIVEIFDQDRLADGTPFLVMEFVNGPRLQDILEHVKLPSQEFIASVLLQIVLGLQSAAEKRIVHRDIKPANILFNSKGVAKISDFGVARFENQDITRPRQLLGTAAFMCPEQIRNATSVGPEADMFSVGVIGYLLLTGRLPFQGRDIETILHAICDDDPPGYTETRGGIYPELKSMVLALLTKRPHLRPSHESIIHSLRNLLMSVGVLDIHQPIQVTLDAFLAKHFAVTTVLESVPRIAKTLVDPPNPAATKPTPMVLRSLASTLAILLICLAIALNWQKDRNSPVTPPPAPTKHPITQADANPVPTPLSEVALPEKMPAPDTKAKTKKQRYQIQVYPLYAELTIDGVRYGMSPVHGSWFPGPHRLEASSGLGQWDTVVEFPANRKTIEMVLNRY
jgi:eukaryotic-like serine/threonine-protein kinase